MFFDTTQLIIKLQGVFAGLGIEAYLVGGYLRDGLMGRDNEDVDIALFGDTIAVAQELARTLGGVYFPLGKEHGVARVIINKNNIPLQIDLTPIAGTIEEDLLSRDFTVDALAVSIEAFDGKWDPASLIDPAHGYKDLRDKVLRATSPRVFEEDPLRLLRGPRLAAERGLTIEEETQRRIREQAHLLSTASPERIRDEFCRILAAPAPASSLRLLDNLELLAVFLPEVTAQKGVSQPKEHYWDVFDHSVETVAVLHSFLEEGDQYRPMGWESANLALPWDPKVEEYFSETVGEVSRGTLLKLAGLLHDLGKPETKTKDETGRTRFFGHAQLGAEMSQSIMERLRFSSAAISIVTKMVEEHLRPGQWSSGEVPTSKAIYRYFRDLGEVAIDTIYLNLADHLAARGPMLQRESWRAHINGARYVLSEYFERNERGSPRKLISGHDVMEKLGIPPGPAVGQMLEAVREAQASGEIATKEEALEYLDRVSLVANR